MRKSTKSHLRGLSSLLKNTFRVHELVAQAMRGECVPHRSIVNDTATTETYTFSHHAGVTISHEEAEQIHARIVCTPAEKWVARAWGKRLR